MISPDRAYDKYSQFGEDGLIEAAFEAIGIRNRWCFEVGAHNGKYLSNTLQWRERGWTAILAESSDLPFSDLQREFGKVAFCVHEQVTRLDDLLSRFNAPHDIDLGVIDVDGQDYWLWHDMEAYRPRVLMIEFSPHLGRDKDYKDKPVPRGEKGQTGRKPIEDLAMERNYRLVAETYVNLIFVDQEAI